MGVVQALLGALFGNGRNAIAETVGLFRENEEAAATRAADYSAAALGQFASEFLVERKGWFDRLMDGLNRLPRPALALGTLALFIAAMIDPVWFAARMQGIALVPEPLWWLMGAIVSFYFGARYQIKAQQFQSGITDSLTRTERVRRNIAALDAMDLSQDAAGPDPAPADNPALADWQAGNG